jgi:hypothetical protein
MPMSRKTRLWAALALAALSAGAAAADDIPGCAKDDPPAYHQMWCYKAPPINRHRPVVKIIVYFASNLETDPGSAKAKQTWSAYVAKAKELLAQHGLDLQVRSASFPFAYDDELILGTASEDEDFEKIVVAGQAVDKDEGRSVASDEYLRVFVLPFREGASSNGDTNGVNDKNFPAILINSRHVSADKATLVHEMGHALGFGHNQNPPGSIYDVMLANEQSGNDRTGVKKEMVDRFAQKGGNWD